MLEVRKQNPGEFYFLTIYRCLFDNKQCRHSANPKSCSELRDALKESEMGASGIAKELEIGRASLYRALES
jgi:hypothetical protein